jgi:hypothetical protein
MPNPTPIFWGFWPSGQKPAILTFFGKSWVAVFGGLATPKNRGPKSWGSQKVPVRCPGPKNGHFWGSGPKVPQNDIFDEKLSKLSASHRVPNELFIKVPCFGSPGTRPNLGGVLGGPRPNLRVTASQLEGVPTIKKIFLCVWWKYFYSVWWKYFYSVWWKYFFIKFFL